MPDIQKMPKIETKLIHSSDAFNCNPMPKMCGVSNIRDMPALQQHPPEFAAGAAASCCYTHTAPRPVSLTYAAAKSLKKRCWSFA